ncbi:hypothetical protein DTO013E5_9283 [Penicillium roqueforti]|uniref:non-specific serine/threonine protein kinase n=1 Tax=Penicillium roqueforti (strain FM164) TaxID=1365484 RepID=W6QL91_PENRF|nr:uncharacterized protein LCP9604111_4860 [Penicillium roqueforti]CDM30302.1 Serine/threonine-protein kinase RAD53 [Penicillium roqueforti FM164]KAF9249144.1 hypothetical protein LCP9604111_4860 [Penicillium roqueforti]KAI2673314.1 hypothetical protein CBS147355_7613 [Penicillium roqueforti]KAI2677410.1 hypothetical protein LCP963914a_8068 [Penicillium roqueforti]KAI2700046.1 hypothetical protein CBS147372_5663 [Penicillium roqueforti]
MSSFPHPHRLALFSLRPLNERAKNVASHPGNKHLTSKLNDGTIVLDIGFHIRSRSRHTIATLGRGGDADLFIEGFNISKIQCSFEIEPNTNVIMLYDRSHGQTTQVFGHNATPFEHGRVRQVVVQKNLNDVLGMGGKMQDVFRFQLLWHENTCLTTERIKELESILDDHVENPRLARTVDDLETVLPSQMQTRIHTAGPLQLKMRYTKIDRLGSGQFGVVYKAIDVDTGKLLAVKILQQPEQALDEEWRKSLYYALKREVEALSQISHPHVVDFITSQGWDGPAAEIFMGLKDGALSSLVLKGDFMSVHDLAKCVCHQMLQALDCLAVNGVVHRDVKPENILYTALPNAQYRFYLGDFGLCNRTVSAHSSVGTPLYTAPEVCQSGAQTHKMDVWSLFVTIAWILDFDGFRQNLQHISLWQAQQALLAITSKIGDIQEMARVDPGERASAAQMLVKRFGGEGLSTQLNQIPPLSPTKPVPKPEAELNVKKYGPAHSSRKVPKQPTNLTRARQPSNPQARVLRPRTIDRLLTKKHELLSHVVESPGFRVRRPYKH